MKVGAKLMTSRQTTLGAVVLSLFVALAANSAGSADAKRQFSVRGLGTHTCSEFHEASSRDEKETAEYANWLTGFFTAYNWLEPDTYDIAPSSQYKQAGLLNFVDLYCGKNPEKRVIDAAIAFVNATYDKRDKARP
jgi:hypothetical protein